MKNIKLAACIAFAILFAYKSNAQAINWAAMNAKQRYIANTNIGWDDGFVIGIGYGYQLHTKLPTVAHLSYSFPSGEKLFDDFKTKIGGTVQLYKIKNFRASAIVEGIFRRYQNTDARLLNFGCELSTTIGYYKKKWFVAGQFGFDKAITTHFKHSAYYKEYYPGAKDGWYIPTGGNFLYGLQGGYSFKNYDINLKTGKTITQDFKTNPMVPYYFQLGFNCRF
ncbi:MAG: hypothetical protein QM737_23540 [Ferruginibacter sp.]